MTPYLRTLEDCSIDAIDEKNITILISADEILPAQEKRKFSFHFKDIAQRILDEENDNYNELAIKEFHRAKIIDWIVQVLRVFGTSAPQTFFIAIDLIDRFYQKRKDNGITSNKNDLHLTGMLSVFIASKMEDVRPIPLKALKEDAGHGKFKSN